MPRDGDDTRRRIVNAAYEFFYREGFARANVDAIAETAGVTKRTLYNHFESKDALVAAVLDLQHELMLSRVDRWARAPAATPPRSWLSSSRSWRPGRRSRAGSARGSPASRWSSRISPATPRAPRRTGTRRRWRRASRRSSPDWASAQRATWRASSCSSSKGA